MSALFGELPPCVVRAQDLDPGEAKEATAIAEAVDAYIDARFDGGARDTRALLARLKREGLAGPAKIEALLRAPRAHYPDADALLGKTSKHSVQCLHVDYASEYLLFVPKDYAHSGKPRPLVVVGHGGNSSMSPARALRVARMYLNAYAPSMSQDLGAIVVAPATSRGWGNIGNSLLFSTISDVQRKLNVDADRVYVTGQSMGGHMSFRAALSLADRFAATSPQSGGYDYVKRKAIANLINIPGYVTWGKREPYGIDRDSRTNAAWAKKHAIDWVFVEKNGGHTIYGDELPKIAKFFAARPRKLYRDRAYLRHGGAMKFVKTWGVKTWPKHTVYSDKRPLRWNVRHWLEVEPRPDSKEPITVFARQTGKQSFELTSSGLRTFWIHLHPKMVDFEKKITITANGKKVFEGRAKPNPKLMLETVREFDDRGRIFWARIRAKVGTDREVAMESVAK